jgi:hypothetical protein
MSGNTDKAAGWQTKPLAKSTGVSAKQQVPTSYQAKGVAIFLVGCSRPTLNQRCFSMVPAGAGSSIRGKA